MAKADWNEVYADVESGKTRHVNGEVVHIQNSFMAPLNFNHLTDEILKRLVVILPYWLLTHLLEAERIKHIGSTPSLE